MTTNLWGRLAAASLTLGMVSACAGMQGPAARGGASGDAIVLYDGGQPEGWRQIGPGSFTVQPDGSLRSEGGMGLLYYAERPFRDFVLDLEYRSNSVGANSGIFVRFPQQTDDPAVPIDAGYEIQIDDSQDPIHQTGSVYTFAPPSRLAAKPVGGAKV